MQASGEGHPGAMAAIIGLPDERLDDLVAAGAGHGTFGVANRNSPGQVVVSVSGRPSRRPPAAAKGLGAKRAVVLPVTVAAHSPLMAEAAAGMRAVLAGVPLQRSGGTAARQRRRHAPHTAEACRAELVDHLTTGVDWIAAVAAMTAAGVTRFVEVGPGRVLSGLIRRIAPDAETLPLDDPNAPGGLADPEPTAASRAARPPTRDRRPPTRAQA